MSTEIPCVSSPLSTRSVKLCKMIINIPCDSPEGSCPVEIDVPHSQLTSLTEYHTQTSIIEVPSGPIEPEYDMYLWFFLLVTPGDLYFYIIATPFFILCVLFFGFLAIVTAGFGFFFPIFVILRLIIEVVKWVMDLPRQYKIYESKSKKYETLKIHKGDYDGQESYVEYVFREYEKE